MALAIAVALLRRVACDEISPARGASRNTLTAAEQRPQLGHGETVGTLRFGTLGASWRRPSRIGERHGRRRGAGLADAARTAIARVCEGRAPRCLARQSVCLFVARIAGVSAHPLEAHVVAGDFTVELFHKSRFFVRRQPSFIVLTKY